MRTPSARSRPARRSVTSAASWGQRSDVLRVEEEVRPPGGDELRRLRQLEDENGRLKRLVADLTLDKHMLSEALIEAFRCGFRLPFWVSARVVEAGVTLLRQNSMDL